MTQSFSKLRRVKLRNALPDEAKDFTPWLCKSENLTHLSDTLGMDLKDAKREVKVGSFSLDILCKNKKDKSLVAIENQFGKSDHKHLGQILTYGAGLKASIMIWIAEDFTDEHLATLKWLNKNNNLNKKTGFFGVKVQAIKIDNSNTAIDFVVVSHPSDWRKPKSRGKKISKEALTSVPALQERYWQKLEKYMADKKSKLSGQDPRPKPTQWFNIGKGGAGIRVKINVAKNKIRLEIYLDRKKTCKAFFNLLHKDKKAIEEHLHFDLDWQEFPQKAYSSIGFDIENKNIKDEKKWTGQHKMINLGVEILHRVFADRILALDPSDWKPTAKK